MSNKEWPTANSRVKNEIRKIFEIFEIFTVFLEKPPVWPIWQRNKAVSNTILNLATNLAT